jgi:hypothetical protein
MTTSSSAAVAAGFTRDEVLRKLAALLQLQIVYLCELRAAPFGGFSENQRLATVRGATGGLLGLRMTPSFTTSTFAAG